MNEVPEFRFRFGLRAMIIGLTVTGCVIGLLGKLMLSNFQIFAAIVSIAAVVAPFLLAIGTLVWIGRRTGNRGLSVWATLLLLMPFVGFGVVGLLQMVSDPSNTGKGAVSNRRLIAGELAKSPDDWQVWRELEHRAVTGKFTKEEVGQVAAELTKYMKSKRPTGAWGEPLNQSEDFFSAARERDLIPEPELIALCDAYFGTEPKINPINAASSTNRVAIEFGSTWDNEVHHGLRVHHMWEINRILIDGEGVELEQNRSHQSGKTWRGWLKEKLKPGMKEITAEIEIAYIDSAKMIGLQDNIPIGRWPKAIKRWKKTVTIPLDGTDPTLQKPVAIQLVTDPARAPKPIEVDRLVIQQDDNGFNMLIVQLTPLHDVVHVDCPAISYDVFVDTGEEEIAVGSVFVIRNGNGTTSNGNQLISRGQKIGVGIEAADLIFRPSPQYMEQTLKNSPKLAGNSEIWGRSQTITDVTLERLDLEARSE